jgi:archaellum biogenesis ATPase FlaH
VVLTSYVVPAIAVCIIFAICLLLVLRNSTSRKANRVAAMVFISFLLWGIVEALTGLPGENDHNLGLLLVQFYAVGVLLVGPSLLHLSLVYPRIKSYPKHFPLLMYLSGLPILLLIFFTKIILDSVRYAPDEWGPVWAANYTTTSAIYIAHPMIFATVAVIILSRTWYRSTSQIEKHQMTIMLMGLIASLISASFTVGVPVVTGKDTFVGTMPTTAPLLIFGISIVYSMLKYKMFDIEAVTEDELDLKESGPTIELEKGYTYIIESKQVEEGYKAFRNLVTTTPGLILTTAFPEKIRVRRNLGKTPIIWLTECSSDAMVIKPWRLDFEMTYTVKNFMEENPETIIMIDDLEYLASVNGLEKTLCFMKDLADMASINNSTIIAPVNPFAFEEKEFYRILATFDKKLDVPSADSAKADVEEGHSYLFDILQMSDTIAQINEGDENRTLCITKTFPEKFVKKVELHSNNIYWLTDMKDGEKSHVSPTRLDFELTDIVNTFIDSVKGSIVILDGFERLIQVNGFKKALDYIKYVEDLISMTKGTLLVSVEWQTLEDNEKSILEKRFDHMITA